MSIPQPVIDIPTLPPGAAEIVSPAPAAAPGTSAQPEFAARGVDSTGVAIGFLANVPSTTERRGRAEHRSPSQTTGGDHRINGGRGRRAADRAPNEDDRAANAGGIPATEDVRAAILDDPAPTEHVGTADSDGHAPNGDGIDRRSGLDRRRGPGRRRTDYRRAAEEGEMTEEQLTFLMAVDEYKRSNDRRHPTLTEILDVLLYLGYRKVAEPGEFKLTKPRQTPERRKPAAPPA